MFQDRKDAGQKLAEALIAYKGRNPLVLAIPRGGVRVGFQVAKGLESDFSIVVVRKLPLPGNPEAGFGAVAEDGSTYFVNKAVEVIHSKTVEQVIEEQKREVERRIDVLREGQPLPLLMNRTVILVDDGIAMGSTMHAAIMLCQNNDADQVVVAAPVAGPSTAADLEEIVDRVVVLEKPPYFHAVAQVYKKWYDVPDEEVVQVMKEFEALQQRG